MSSRYESAKTAINNDELYQELREERNVNSLEQFRTAVHPKLTAEVRSNFVSNRHVWTTGDTLWKIAAKHYNDPKLWWLLAWYNEKPTESHITVGNVILIPTPVEEVISYFHFGV